MIRNLVALAILGLALPLAGCGGGGGGSEPLEPTVRAGQFDTAFGNGGLFELSSATFANTQTRANSVTVDTAGRLLLAGWTAPLPAASPADALVVRVLTNGALDIGFANAGALVAPFRDGRPGDGRWAFPVAGGGAIFVQATLASCAKIVLPPPPPACNLSLPDQVDVLRLMPDGALDGNWGQTSFGPLVEAESRQQPDGSVVILTFYSGASSGGVLLRRVGADGKPDHAFSEKADAALLCPELPATSFHLGAMAVLANGKILVARKNTRSSAGNPIRTCVTRLNADGTLDSSYGAGGRMYLDGEPQTGASLVALLARNDGGAALVMSDNVFGRARFGSIAWLTPDGAVDTSRGAAGLTSPLPLGAVTGAAMQSDGKIVLGGWPYDAASTNLGSPFFYNQPRLLRLDAAGLPDRTFGAAGDGIAPLVVAGRFLHPMHIAFGADGSIFAAGFTAANVLAGSGEASRLAVGKLTGVAR